MDIKVFFYYSNYLPIPWPSSSVRNYNLHKLTKKLLHIILYETAMDMRGRERERETEGGKDFKEQKRESGTDMKSEREREREREGGDKRQ